jgi:hypothetical protein
LPIHASDVSEWLVWTGAGSLSQFQHSTGKTGFPLKGEWLDILGANFLCKTLAKFAQLEISVV